MRINNFFPWYPSPLTPGGFLSPLAAFPAYGYQGQAGFNVGLTLPWFGTVRGRAGYLVTPTWLIYGTAGLAYGEVQGGASGFSNMRVGWAAGGGVRVEHSTTIGRPNSNIFSWTSRAERLLATLPAWVGAIISILKSISSA